MTQGQNGKPATSSIIILPETAGVADPTLPSKLWPGSIEALKRGCSCPVEENITRLRLGAQPMLNRVCRVHSKICQAGKCEHGQHADVHERCEHCTNVLHECVVCGKVYLDDGDDPVVSGWKLVENDPIVKGWRCKTCL